MAEKESMNPGYDSFIFTHIPKCGGTSFRQYINVGARASGLKNEEIYIPGENGLAHDKNLVDLDEQALAGLKGQPIRLLADHSKFGVHRSFPQSMQQPFYYSILRHPIKRVLSHYYFFCYVRGDHQLKGVRLEDLKEDQLVRIIKKFSNIQLIYLAGRRYRNWEDTLQRGKLNLLKYYPAVGILEKMGMSLKLLRGLKPEWLQLGQDFPSTNANPAKDPMEHDPRILDLIKAQNIPDLKIYQFSLNLLQKKLSDLKS